MKATLGIINQMQADGVIACYGLGGAVGATYYSEPATVLEMEVLVIPPFNQNGKSASLTVLQDYLVGHGGSVVDATGQIFDVAGWPVRFVVARNNLERAAVAGSIPVPLEDSGTFVIPAEYLVAIALSEKRAGDLMWMLRLADRDAIDELGLKSILTSHGLVEEWAEFERKFPRQFPANDDMRSRLAALSFSEKIEILEKLRDRELAIAAAGLRKRVDRKDDSSAAIQVCQCLAWEPCGCGNQPPYHCMRCSRELTAEQVVVAKQRGFYSGKES